MKDTMRIADPECSFLRRIDTAMKHTLTLVAAVLLTTGMSGLRPTSAAQMTFEEIGVPVKETGVLGWCVGPDTAGKLNTIYISHNQIDGALFLVSVNTESGEVKQYASPIEEPGAWACCLAADKRVYLGATGSHGPTQVLRFDPRDETFVSLGCPAPSERYLWTFSPTPDGMIYAGTHGHAKLVEINTITGELTDLGRMSEVDEYTRYTWYGEADRTVYAAVYFTDKHIVAYLRDKQAKVRVDFPGLSGPGIPFLYEADDGHVYAEAFGKVWRLSEGRAELLPGRPAGVRKLPRASGISPMFVSGSTRVADLRDGRFVIETRAGAVILGKPGSDETSKLDYDYACDGAGIFLVRPGPGGRVYGSSAMPLRLFEYDPETRRLTNLGRCSAASGEVYSFAHLNGKLYIAAYGAAHRSVYDPDRSYHFGSDPIDNPRALGPVGHEQNRPHSTEPGFDGNIWTASRPAYGKYGGALSRMVPGTHVTTVWRNLIPEQSIIALAMDAVQGLIWCGTDIGGGRGTKPKAREAVLFAFDPKKEEVVWQCVPCANAHGITALAMGSNGLLYGARDDAPELFIFDTQRRQVLARLHVSGIVHMEALQLGNDRCLYGMAGDTFFRLRPEDHDVVVLGRCSGATRGFALVDQTVYFAKGRTLMAGHILDE